MKPVADAPRAAYVQPRRSQSGPRQWLEYAALRCLTGLLGAMPRAVARGVGGGLGQLAYVLAGRLRRVGHINLRIAFPTISERRRRALLRQTFGLLGVQLAEFCRMRRYTVADAEEIFRYEGLEHLLLAEARGRGVLIVTAHLGAWELSSFLHSLMGHPMGMVIRRLDNALVDGYVNAIRCLHGNRVFHKDDFARALIKEMREGRTVGILMDTNMRPPQGVFVPFFGVEACTASGLARVAQRTGAAVLPGFLLWEEGERRYVLRFGQELPVETTGDAEADAVVNTARFTRAIEDAIRQHPEQWLWMHRRWKTRPPGAPGVY